MNARMLKRSCEWIAVRAELDDISDDALTFAMELVANQHETDVERVRLTVTALRADRAAKAALAALTTTKKGG